MTFKMYTLPTGNKKSQTVSKWKLDIILFKGKTELDLYTIKKGDSPVIQVHFVPNPIHKSTHCIKREQKTQSVTFLADRLFR